MTRIANEAKKEIADAGNPDKLKSFLSDAIDAIKTLNNVNLSVTRYIKDYDYKMIIRRLGNQIESKDIADGLETKYGPLLYNGRMRFKRLKQQELKENYYLMIFKFTILIFEVVENRKANFMVKWLSAEDQAMPSLTHVDTISIRDTRNTILVVPDSRGIATVQVLDDDFSLNQHESFNIYGFPGQDIQSVQATIEEIINNTHLRPSSKHTGHKFQPIDAAAVDHQKPPECGQCGMFVYGLVFLGYRCDDCNRTYHEKCFVSEDAKAPLGMISNISQ